MIRRALSRVNSVYDKLKEKCRVCIDATKLATADPICKTNPPPTHVPSPSAALSVAPPLKTGLLDSPSNPAPTKWSPS